MAKTTGLGDNFYLDGYNLSGDTGSIGRVGGGPAALDVTGIDKSAYERLGGLRDGALEWSTWINFTTSASATPTDPTGEHEALRTLALTNRIGSYLVGTTLGNPAASAVGKQVNYDWSRAGDAALSASVQLLPNGYGVEWGNQLTAGVDNATAAASGTGVDFAASTAFGLQAYLHVFDLDGDDATFTIEHSDDNGTDPWTAVTGGAFTEVTAAPASERIQTSRTLAVKRWLRVTVTGTFTSVDFAVVAVKNTVEVLF